MDMLKLLEFITPSTKIQAHKNINLIDRDQRRLSISFVLRWPPLFSALWSLQDT